MRDSPTRITTRDSTSGAIPRQLSTIRRPCARETWTSTVTGRRYASASPSYERLGVVERVVDEFHQDARRREVALGHVVEQQRRRRHLQLEQLVRRRAHVGRLGRGLLLDHLRGERAQPRHGARRRSKRRARDEGAAGHERRREELHEGQAHVSAGGATAIDYPPLQSKATPSSLGRRPARASLGDIVLWRATARSLPTASCLPATARPRHRAAQRALSTCSRHHRSRPAHRQSARCVITRARTRQGVDGVAGRHT